MTKTNQMRIDRKTCDQYESIFSSDDFKKGRCSNGNLIVYFGKQNKNSHVISCAVELSDVLRFEFFDRSPRVISIQFNGDIIYTLIANSSFTSQ